MKKEDMPIMECGCQANSMGKPAHYEGEAMPSCVIHSCFKAAAPQPDYSGRKARCFYYGKKTRKSECNYKGDVKENGEWVCRCERPTTPNLPFMKLLPNKDYDEFYCGCHSWN